MLNDILQQLNSLLENQLVGGGLFLMVVGAALAMARRLPAQLAELLSRRISVSVELLGHDKPYDWVSAWLDTQPYTQRARRLTVERIRTADFTRKTVYNPAPGLHWFWYRGRLIVLKRTRRELEAGGNGPQPPTHERLVLTVLGLSQQPVRRLIDEAKRRYEDRQGAVDVSIAKGHQWIRIKSYEARSIDSVVLPGGLEREIEEDVRRFLDSKQWYEERGVPWRRGYLLHGPPGTGKTTLISALAGQVGFDLGIISLAGPGINDDTLVRLMLDAPENTAIVLEDVDTVLDGRSVSGAKAESVTFSGLLNVLDGFTARPGQIVWMTTNHVAKLDPALVRPGRMDRVIEFGPATAEQAERLMRHFYGDSVGPAEAHEFARAMTSTGATMADVQQRLLMVRELVVDMPQFGSDRLPS